MLKIMKKISACLLACVLTMALFVGCGGGNSSVDSTGSSVETSSSSMSSSDNSEDSSIASSESASEDSSSDSSEDSSEDSSSDSSEDSSEDSSSDSSEDSSEDSSSDSSEDSSEDSSSDSSEDSSEEEDDAGEDLDENQKWKIATTTSDLNGDSKYNTDEKIIRGLYQAGFRYIDLSMYSFTANSVYMQSNWRTEVLALKAVADELGMKFIQAHSQGGNPLSTNSAEVDFLVQATIRSIEICEVLGIENTVVHPGVRAGLSKYQWFEANKAFFERLLPTAERCGVNILCENSTSANTGSNYFINSGADMREFIEYVDHPNFHGCWDTGHANCEPGSQYDDIVTLGDEMYAIHYADNLGTDSHLMPFFGSLNHNEVMQALEDIGYEGYFTLECDGSQRTQAYYTGPEFDWMTELYPDEELSSIPKYLDLMQQEVLLYQLAEYILETYPNPQIIDEQAFSIFATMNSYGSISYGQPTDVSSTEDTITVNATTRDNNFRGFQITRAAVNSWMKLGLTYMEFTLTSDAPYICVFSNSPRHDFLLNASTDGTITGDLDGAYYASGSTIKISLETLYLAASENFGLEFVFTTTNRWEPYMQDAYVTFSNIKFTNDVIELPDDSLNYGIIMNMLSKDTSYESHIHGTLGGVEVVDEDTVKILANKSIYSEFSGVMIPKSTIGQLISLGLTELTFTWSTAAYGSNAVPGFADIYASGVPAPSYQTGLEQALNDGGSDAYYPSGSTITINLAALYNQIQGDNGLKFVLCSTQGWTASASAYIVLDFNFADVELPNAMDILSTAASYAEHGNGAFGGLEVINENTVKILANKATYSDFSGFMITRTAIGQMINLGITELTFTWSTSAYGDNAVPGFADIYASATPAPSYQTGLEQAVNKDGGTDAYYPSGSTITVDLVALYNQIDDYNGLKFVLCSTQGWTASAPAYITLEFHF